MSQNSLRRPLSLAAGATLVGFLLLRYLITVQAWRQAAGGDFSVWLPWWILDAAGTGVILVAAVAACGWLAERARRRDRELARTEHLAEIGLLAGGLAHEIRNTLNAMHSQIALLRKHLPPDAGLQAVQRTAQIERAVAELEELVTEFLTFARPAKDQLEDLDLAALIRGVLDFVALDLEQARVAVVAELDPALPAVYADAAKLKRVLLNLIINARQAMPEGGTLTVRARPTGRGLVLIEVSDTGCGIPEDGRERIFQTFFTTRVGGTGLGLAIVKRTVEDLGGRIDLDSQVGRGTTFRIYLASTERRRLRRVRHTGSRREEQWAAGMVKRT